MSQQQQEQQVTEVASRVSEARLDQQVQQLLHPIPQSEILESIFNKRVGEVLCGNLYVGEKKDGKPHGRGVLYWQSCRTFQFMRYYGFFEDSTIHGYGELQVYGANGWEVQRIGEFYLGVFVCGYYGFTPDGRHSYGNFKDHSMKEMNGRVISPNGSQRVGYFDRNMYLRSYSEQELEVFLNRERLDAARFMLMSMSVRF